MEKRTESRTGRFSHLLRGSARPRRHHALMIALVLVALLSFAGVVSADDTWVGYAPTTANGISGVVNGGVDVQYVDTWTWPDNIDTDSVWANFTLNCNPSTDEIKIARLYVTVYMGNMTAPYEGIENIDLYRNGADPESLAYDQYLDLTYDGTGPTFVDVYDYTSYYINNISRVTSDYQNVFDITDLVSSQNLDVYIESTNISGKYDGRIKEVKLVYGWNVTSNSPGNTRYWINEGHDPITKNMVTYTGNKTLFNGIGTPASYSAKLWVDYLSNSTYYSTVGYGKYWWNNPASHILTPGCSGTGCYPPVITKGYYSGLLSWNWTQSSTNTPGMQNNNVLMYSNTSSWYKIPLAVLTIK